MRAEIICVGTELLVGSILNTNARFLSQQLAKHAIDLYHQVTVGDNAERLQECLRQAFERSDIIITSGGLGPTEDDITVRSAAAFLKKPLIYHEPTHHAIQKRLKVRRLPMTRMIARQCYVPQGALVLNNVFGTAPGILCETIFRNQKKWLLLLPGPPRELEPLFLSQALPLLLKRCDHRPEHFVIRSVKLSGLIEAQVAEKVAALLKLKPPVTVGIYARPGEVELKIMSKAASRTQAMRNAAKTEATIKRRLAKYIFGYDEETLESSVGKLLLARRKTLSAAESCTGGLLSSRLTRTPGSSRYFKGAVVAYHNQVKQDLLKVPSALLAQRGAVSSQTAIVMARHARQALNTDYSLSITGIAGPDGGSRSKPVGLVYMALATPKHTIWKKYLFLGTRQDIQMSATNAALNLLRFELTR